MAGGFEYFYEENEGTTRLEVYAKGEVVFTMVLLEGKGAGFAADKRVSACYDGSGRLVEVSLLATDCLGDLIKAGELTLPDDVAEKVKEQLENGVHWAVSMEAMTEEKPYLVFLRADLRLDPVYYELRFNLGLPFGIPGTDWYVRTVKEDDRVGFEFGGVTGEKVTYWFNSFLNIEDMPNVDTAGRTKMKELMAVVFPGYELKAAKKKAGQKFNGGGD